MRRSHWLARSTLALVLALSSGALAGCEDENDPKTWVEKLPNDAKRPGAARRLVGLFHDVMQGTRPEPNNPRDPAVQRFLGAVLPPLTQSFTEHPDDTTFRQDAIEILAQSQDPRALPGLIAALSYRPGNADSERIALRAAQALKEMAPTISDAQKAQVSQALIATIDRAQGASGNPQQIRYNAIQALGALKSPAAVDTLTRLLSRRLGDQDISTARASADALGEIGDPRGVDALVYGAYLNIRGQNAYNHSLRALAKIGAPHAVPKLVQTLQGQNAQVEGLIQQYQGIPNAPPVPDGLVKSTAADMLRVFAAPESTPALLEVLRDRQTPESARAAAGEALAYIAVAVPAQRDQILAALTSVFNENQPSADHVWTATLMAPRLAIVGDPRSVAPIRAALAHRAVQDDEHANTRVDLLLAYASLARHGDVAGYDPVARGARAQLQGIVQREPEAARQVQPYLAALDRLDRVVSVARDCADGDRACYQGKLGDASGDVVRKAAYMIAWTTPPAEAAQARQALLARIAHPDVQVRRSIMVALDRLSPTGCPECVTRLGQLIEQEKGQESKILSHLDALLLMGRLRTRAAGH